MADAAISLSMLARPAVCATAFAAAAETLTTLAGTLETEAVTDPANAISLTRSTDALVRAVASPPKLRTLMISALELVLEEAEPPASISLVRSAVAEVEAVAEATTSMLLTRVADAVEVRAVTVIRAWSGLTRLATDEVVETADAEASMTLVSVTKLETAAVQAASAKTFLLISALDEVTATMFACAASRKPRLAFAEVWTVALAEALIGLSSLARACVTTPVADARAASGLFRLASADVEADALADALTETWNRAVATTVAEPEPEPATSFSMAAALELWATALAEACSRNPRLALADVLAVAVAAQSRRFVMSALAVEVRAVTEPRAWSGLLRLAADETLAVAAAAPATNLVIAAALEVWAVAAPVAATDLVRSAAPDVTAVAWPAALRVNPRLAWPEVLIVALAAAATTFVTLAEALVTVTAALAMAARGAFRLARPLVDAEALAAALTV